MHGLVLVAFVVLCVLVLGLAGVLYLVVVQHGRALLRLEEFEEYAMRVGHGGTAPPAPPERRALEVGTEAPEFTLRDLDGRKRRLRDYRGAPLVVAFFDPRCGFCLKMSERLGRLPEQAHRVLLVTQGEIDENRRLRDAHGWRCDVVHEDDWKVVGAYKISGTPSAYLVDAEGRIASPPAVGADALVALATGDEPARTDANGRGARPLRTRDVSESRLVRDGLPVGTVAPDFTLPDLDGATRSLKDFLGKHVLLVFSDVDCAPCTQLAPSLVDLQRRRADELDVVMISRGDPEANRLKATLFDYPFPVLLQRSREVLKAYGTFETPSAYLLDADGVVARDLAVGGDSILELASAFS